MRAPRTSSTVRGCNRSWIHRLSTPRSLVFDLLFCFLLFRSCLSSKLAHVGILRAISNPDRTPPAPQCRPFQTVAGLAGSTGPFWAIEHSLLRIRGGGGSAGQTRRSGKRKEVGMEGMTDSERRLLEWAWTQGVDSTMPLRPAYCQDSSCRGCGLVSPRFDVSSRTPLLRTSQKTNRLSFH